MEFHSSGRRELNSSPTAENKLLFTALATWRETTSDLYSSVFNSSVTLDILTVTNPVEAWLSAELVGPSSAEVVVGPEGLIERGDEVEQGLPANFITQRVLPVLAALPQPAHRQTQDLELPHQHAHNLSMCNCTAKLTVRGLWCQWTEGEKGPPGHVAPLPGRTA